METYEITREQIQSFLGIIQNIQSDIDSLEIEDNSNNQEIITTISDKLDALFIQIDAFNHPTN